MSASTLRAAAALIRQRANAANETAWGRSWWSPTPTGVHIEGWSPRVASDAAGLLEKAAQVGPAHGGILWDAAVTFARTYLGESA